MRQQAEPITNAAALTCSEYVSQTANGMRPNSSQGLLQLYGELAKHSLTQEQACLLQGSASRGAKATRKQELSRALKLERAGLPVDPQSGLHQQSNGSRAIHCASADAACQDPLGNGTCHQLQPGLAGPARDDTAATMFPEQEVATSDEGNDPDGSESSGADLAAVDPNSSKRQKLGEGSAQSSQLAERSLAAGAAASGLADVRTALKQSKAELGLLGEGSFFLRASTQQLWNGFTPYMLFLSLSVMWCAQHYLLCKHPIAKQTLSQ